MIYDSSKVAVNKLIILYILDRMEMPLTKNQITNMVLESNLINYFNLQQCLSELEQYELVKKLEKQDKLTYTLSENGRNTLEIFRQKISTTTKKTIDEYIAANKNKIKQEAQIIADFYKKADNEYIVNLKVIENDIVLIDLKLSVVSSKQAKFICEKWKNSSEKIYGQIMNTLIN